MRDSALLQQLPCNTGAPTVEQQTLRLNAKKAEEPQTTENIVCAGLQGRACALRSNGAAAEPRKADCENRLRPKYMTNIHKDFMEENDMKTALTIAGSDSSGGAGIQADIKTMTVNGVFAMSAITALTAQNTQGVTGILEVSPDFLEKQIDTVVQDIFPDAVKTGMVSSSALIEVIARSVQKWKLPNFVVDPVMVATSGARLINEDAADALENKLLPLACVITPNIPEAEVFAGMKIKSSEDMEKAAKTIYERYGCAVLCKGGHSAKPADDFLFYGNGGRWFFGKQIETSNTHGTGCTLSSAIASNLAKGFELEASIEKAKEYISGALAAKLKLGKGAGPMNHAYVLRSNTEF